MYCGTYTISSSRSVASARGSKRALRGLYYSSPFVRALQTSPQVNAGAGQECAGVQESVVQVLARFREVVGEALMPHFCFSNSPQVSHSSKLVLASAN